MRNMYRSPSVQSWPNRAVRDERRLPQEWRPCHCCVATSDMPARRVTRGKFIALRDEQTPGLTRFQHVSGLWQRNRR